MCATAMMMLLLPLLLSRGRCVVGSSDEAVLDDDGDDDDWRWRWRRIRFEGGVYSPRKAIFYRCLDRGVWRHWRSRFSFAVLCWLLLLLVASFL